MQTADRQGLQYKVMAIYGKPLVNEHTVPLLDPGPLQDIKLQQTLKTLSRSVLQRVQRGIKQTVYSIAAKTMLAKSLRIEVLTNSIRVSASHPAFKPLIMGQKRQQMLWLVKARAPIPIITETGELIFRSATAKSMANGSWVHPGRQSTGIIERARIEAREMVKKKLIAEIRGAIRRAAKS